METSATCPRCGSGNVRPILYGMPGLEMTEDSMAGKVALGGCMVFPEAPDRLTLRQPGRVLRGSALFRALPRSRQPSPTLENPPTKSIISERIRPLPGSSWPHRTASQRLPVHCPLAALLSPVTISAALFLPYLPD
jgi:hypothetical protein